MFHLEMHVMSFRIRSSVTTLFADINLIPSLFVCIVMGDTMNLEGVRLQGTPLGKGLVTVITFVWSDTYRNR